MMRHRGHLTIADAQKRLGISKRAMNHLIADGTIPTMRAGGHVVIAAIDADLLLDDLQAN